jgi:hypothetical protein
VLSNFRVFVIRCFLSVFKSLNSPHRCVLSLISVFDIASLNFGIVSAMSGLEIARFEMKTMKNWGLELTILLDI